MRISKLTKALTLITFMAMMAFPQFLPAQDLPMTSPLYNILDRLWAEGKIEGYRPDMKPISLREANDLLADMEGTVDIRGLLRDPEKSWIAPWVALEGGDDGFIPETHSGIPVAVGPILGAEGALVKGAFSLYGNMRIPLDDHDVLFPELYGNVTWKTMRLTLGKEDLWWGPGKRGSLLLTNNAQALEMLRLENYPDFELPWIFRYLGGVRFNFFLSRLEEDREDYVSEPLMGGLKFSFSPHDNFIFSLNRTFLYGGEGRDESLEALLRVLFGSSGSDTQSEEENVIGNQIGGISFFWRIPLRSQPFTLYGELAGEDSASVFPTMSAFLLGIYIPRLGPLRIFDLRLEAADNSDDGTAWYVHSDYPYTYKGRVMGHPMGTDAADYFGELGIYPSANSRVALSGSRTRKGLSQANVDELWRWKLAADYWTDRITLFFELISEKWDSVPPGDEEGEMLALGIKFNL